MRCCLPGFIQESIQFFKHAGFFVLPHVLRIKITTVHSHVHAGRQGLHKGHGAAQVKQSIRRTKLVRDHGAGNNNGFVFYFFCQQFGGIGHRIGTVGDDDLVFLALAAMLCNQGAVVVRHFQAVHHHQGSDLHRHQVAAQLQHFGQVRIFKKQLAVQLIVLFVESSACNKNPDAHEEKIAVKIGEETGSVSNNRASGRKSFSRHKTSEQFCILLMVPINYPMTIPFAIENEQEASVAIILSCMVGQQDQQVIDFQFRRLSLMLSLSLKFQHYSLEQMAGKAMPLLATYGNQKVIEYCAPFIPDNFKETLFAMLCELLTANGELSESESEILGIAALHLGISIELMRVMITTFLMRNRWNVM